MKQIKLIIYCSLFSGIVSCGETPKEEKPAQTDTIAEVKTEPVKTETVKAEPVFPHFNSVKDMFMIYGYYSKADTTFEVLSQKPLHIRISDRSLESEPEGRSDWSVKRSIV